MTTTSKTGVINKVMLFIHIYKTNEVSTERNMSKLQNLTLILPLDKMQDTE